MRDFKEQPSTQSSTQSDRRSNHVNNEEDSAFAMLAKLKERLMKKSLKDNVLLHRKVLRLDRGKKTIMISALREENSMFDNTDKKPLNNEKYLIKLVLNENKRIDVTDPTRNVDGAKIE